MIILERYLAQIGRYLPKKDRKDTLDELRSLLLENYDNILENETVTEDQALRKAISDFGHPRTVAMEYKNETPILSKQIEPLVFLILKIVSISLPGAILLATMLDYYTSNDTTTTMGLLLELAYAIPGIIQALATSLAFIFLFFIFIDRKANLKFDFKEEPFNPDLLPPIPTDSLKVSRFEAMFSVLGGVVFLYLFNLQPGLIAVYFDGNKIPLLNENFEKILPLLNVSVMISIAYSILFFIKGYRTKFSATIEFFQSILAAYILYFLASSDIFNDIIIEGHDLNFLTIMFTIGMYIGMVGTIIGAIVKYVKVLLSDPEQIKIVKQ